MDYTIGALSVPPMFPSNVSIGGVSITLHADGSWSGDGEAFLTALKDAKMDGTVITMPLLWFIANAIRNTKQMRFVP